MLLVGGCNRRTGVILVAVCVAFGLSRGVSIQYQYGGRAGGRAGGSERREETAVVE